MGPRFFSRSGRTHTLQFPNPTQFFNGRKGNIWTGKQKHTHVHIHIRASSKTRVKWHLDNCCACFKQFPFQNCTKPAQKKLVRRIKEKKGEVYIYKIWEFCCNHCLHFSRSVPTPFFPERNFSSMMIREKILALSLPHIFSFRKKDP